MKYPDRTCPPEIQKIKQLELIKPSFLKLKNGLTVYFINAGDQDVVKIELLFKAGSYYQNKSLVAKFTSRMLREGTKTKTSRQIAEIIDYYGIHFSGNSDKDFASVSVLSQTKYLSKILPLLSEIIYNPSFPEDELRIIAMKHKQNFQVSMQKVKQIARENFWQLIFGKHPYGQIRNAEDFNNILRNDLLDFYNDFYLPKNSVMIVSGKIKEEVPALIEKALGQDVSENDFKDNIKNGFNYSPDKKLIPKVNALQSAIRIGKPMFTKNHPDYIKMKILTTVLGGYFGSRLMSNIREDKGYTYGIGAGLISLQKSGYFFIATEVGAEVRKQALDEIYKEIDVLQNELVPSEELFTVKNYMIGNLMHSLDGSVGLSEVFKNLVVYGLDFNYINRIIETINNVRAEDLREMAQKYLAPESLSELVVGK